MRKSFSLLLVLCMLLITGLYVVSAEGLTGEEEFSFDALVSPPLRRSPPRSPFTSRTAASKSR